MTKPALPSRQAWISTLAKAPEPLLEQCVVNLGVLPPYAFLRAPEIGLTMVRGRAEGTGIPFNLGEMTLTRCVVQLAGSDASASEAIAGFGYVAGRSHRHAELAALCDAMLQHYEWHDQVHSRVILPLQAAYREARERQEQQTEATQVNFFTLLRGES